MQGITPFFWFNHEAEEAASFYVSLFEDAKILNIERYKEGQPGPTGQVFIVTFQLEGQEFMALNGRPAHEGFTEALSLYVDCPTQAKIDKLWDAFAEEGEPIACGWIKDKYGVTWQLVPSILEELLQGSDRAKAQRAMDAMLKMQKLDIKTLQEA
jgi:predicted 3-demethylubiquinone-9 3-methyltransferase (glyoxalase superfamily)